MKKVAAYFILTGLIPLLGACTVVGMIFKAGMVWGIVLVVLLVVGIIYLITGSRK